MNRVPMFVKLDFYTIKPYTKSFLILIGLAIVMSIMFSSVEMVSMYMMMSLILTMSYPFSIGDKYKMDMLYSTLSLDRRNVVVGRYAFAVCMEAICFILIPLLSCVMSFFIKVDFDISQVLLIVCVSSFVYALITALQYPIYFKMGYDKAKLVAFLPMGLIFIGITFLPKIFPEDGVSAETVNSLFMGLYESASRPLLYALPVLAGFLLLAVSCFISCRVYKARDL